MNSSGSEMGIRDPAGSHLSSSSVSHFSIENGLTVNKNGQDDHTKTAHKINHDPWYQLASLLVVSFNGGYILGFSNFIMTPLGWIWGTVLLAVLAVISLYANCLLAKLHIIDGRRFIRYRDLMGFTLGRKMYYITCTLQFLNFILGNIGFLLLSGRALKVVLMYNRTVARHKRMCPPGRATYTRTIRTWSSCVMHLSSGALVYCSRVLSAFTALLGNRRMALQSHGLSVILPQFVLAHALVLREVLVVRSLVLREVARGYLYYLNNSGMYGISVILPQSGIRFGCSKVVWAHSLVTKEASRGYTCHSHNSGMQRERQRMISRRGSSRGRASSQRPAPFPSSSIEVSSDRKRSRGRAVGRGRAAKHREIMDCGHSTHPMVRYRIPCTLSNSTFFVTVSVEHCSNPRGQDDALQASPPRIPGLAPTIDMQVPAIDMMRPVQDSFSPDPGAGPSEPVQRNILTEPDIHKLPRCKTEEDPHTTDDD